MSGWKVQFTPQIVVNGCLADIDPEGDAEWPIAVTDARQVAASNGDASRLLVASLERSPGVPSWVRSWDGPGRLSLVDPEGKVAATGSLN